MIVAIDVSIAAHKMKPLSMLTFLCLCFVGGYTNSREDIYIQDIFDDMQDEWTMIYLSELFSLCPSTIYYCAQKIMQGNASIVSSSYPINNEHCCLIFDCFDSCNGPSNCSYHLQNLDVSRPRQFLKELTCMDPIRYGKTNLDKYDLENVKPYGYITVSSCPENSNIQERLLCENMTDEEYRPLIDTIPVTANDVHFANRICASCNHVKNDYDFWDVKIKCSNTSRELDVTLDNLNQEVKGREDCFLQYVPHAQTSKTPRCMLHTVRSCNVTGDWVIYSRQIEDLCLDPFLDKLYKVGFGRQKIRYKNVFCAICNGMTEIDFTGCTYTFEPSDLFIDFTMVIALSTEETIQTIEAERCILGHIFIPVINDCVKIHCSTPLVFDVVHKTCTSPTPPHSRDRVRITLSFEVQLSEIVTLSSRHELESAISDSLSMFDYRPCSLLFAYSLQNNTCEMNNNVTGNFDVVYMFFQTLKKGTLHHKALESKNRLPSTRSIIIDGTNLTIEFLRFGMDPSFITNGDDLRLKQERQCIYNPHNKHTVVMFPSECSDSVEEDRMYSITYMECPSILLSLHTFDVERNKHGLHFKNTDTYIPFSDFKTYNSSHVKVCQKNLLAMEVTSAAGRLILNACVSVLPMIPMLIIPLFKRFL